MPGMTEDLLETTALSWFAELGYRTLHGPDLAPDGCSPERDDYRQTILVGRLRQALERINTGVSAEGIDEAMRRILNPPSPDLMTNNRALHRLLTDGVDVEVAAPEEYGGTQHVKVWLFDLDDVANNEFLALNQYTVIEEPSSQGSAVSGKKNRRADVVVFVNGLPLGVLELKNPGSENATIRHAFNQLQTYKADIPSLFTANEVLVISDGLQARLGTLSSGWDRFMPWRTVDGTGVAPKGTPELETLIRGVFEPRRFLDYVLNFVVFEDDGAKVIKKAAAYHQYWAVNRALSCTFSACGIDADERRLIGRFPAFDPNGELAIGEGARKYGKGTTHFGGHRIGVIWHTQGSGKSLSMTFYAGKVIRHPDMGNPTLVVITDRNDLDEQLFTTFANCRELLRQTPVQAASRAHLKDLLKVASGGVIFTTIQKFAGDDTLTTRENVVVIADEAHRSQYGFIDGFARKLHEALPHASFIGFTGTPVESDDRSTPAVFGDYIDKYDILRAVEDGATVPIYYESRLAKLELEESEKPKIDPEFEEITEGEEETQKQRLRSKWAALEAMVGTERRVGLVARDLVAHFEKRLEVLDGKAMVVCMSRRICVDMYNAIVALRPAWHSPDDACGRVKIVMSGSASDNPSWQPHIRTKNAREDLARRFKNPGDGLQIVIVRDMWLTGFDCPSMHTMYLDKPMSGHNLMQAIARVNRVFRDKPGGLVVDYLGLADSLKRALANYTASGGKGSAAIDREQAMAVFLEKFEIVQQMFHNFDYRAVVTGPVSGRIAGIAQAMEFVLSLEDGKKRYLPAVSNLSRAFALVVPDERALALRDDIAFFQEVRAALIKATGDETGRSQYEVEAAVRQLVSKAVASTEVVDIFAAAGMDRPDISILSDEFLEEVKHLPQRNLALELLKKLINDEIKGRSRKNVVQARSFAEMLELAVRKYQNRAIEAAEVIQELIDLAKKIREAQGRGEKLGLNDDEMAFYDALADNGSAREVMGDESLCLLAQELVNRVRESVSIDWQMRENARAQIRVLVKRVLRKYGYPPDMALRATELVLEQTEALCREWTL
ncbi:MAG TPA: type I restriction endonuclease subunit R [Lentisphaeria bacterium]|nr:type I restriction endonuclease subunit R [Lentisphaeria bacterium]